MNRLRIWTITAFLVAFAACAGPNQSIKLQSAQTDISSLALLRLQGNYPDTTPTIINFTSIPLPRLSKHDPAEVVCRIQAALTSTDTHQVYKTRRTYLLVINAIAEWDNGHWWITDWNEIAGPSLVDYRVEKDETPISTP